MTLIAIQCDQHHRLSKGLASGWTIFEIVPTKDSDTQNFKSRGGEIVWHRTIQLINPRSTSYLDMR